MKETEFNALVHEAKETIEEIATCMASASRRLTALEILKTAINQEIVDVEDEDDDEEDDE